MKKSNPWLIGVCFLWLAVFAAPAFAAWTPTASTNVSAGAVVVCDADADNAVETTTSSGATPVCGIAMESKSSGNSVRVVSEGDYVLVNCDAGTTRGQWLITHTVAGQCIGVDTMQTGVFGIARTDADSGQCYAQIVLGLQDSSSGGLADAADIIKDTHIDWGGGANQVSADDMPDGSTNIIPTSTQESAWDAAAAAAHTAGTDPGLDSGGANAVTAAQAKAAYTHSGVTTGNPHAVTAAQAGAIATTLPDAKGDLISASADDTPARLGVGTNDHVLAAASGETTGLIWKAITESMISDLLHNAGMIGYIYVDLPNFIANADQTGYGIVLDAEGKLELQELPGASGGEANVAENLGTGVGIYEDKSGLSLRVNSVKALHAAMSIYEDETDEEIDFDFIPGAVVHNQLQGLDVGDPHTQYKKESDPVVIAAANFLDPNGVYDIDQEFWLAYIGEEAPNGITITAIRIETDNASYEITGTLVYADDLQGRANATTIDTITTTSGKVAITAGFDDATVPNGKTIYLVLSADPNVALTQFGITVWGTIDQ